MCSTPFGIKEKDTPITTGGYTLLVRCSTPFGIKEKDTKAPAAHINSVDMCSTPFGIKEKDTGWKIWESVFSGGAQRLSASKRRTRREQRG